MTCTIPRGGRSWLAAICLTLAATQAHADTAGLTAAALTRWMDGYRAAWETRNPEQAAGLFTADATYQETPYDKPFDGQAGIREYWANVTRDQRNVKFEYQILSVSGGIGIVHWAAKFESASSGSPVGLDGIFVLDFAADGRCARLREWWHVQPAQ